MCWNLSLLQRKICPSYFKRHEEFDGIVDNLDPTEDGEASEEPHGAADETKLGLKGHLHITLYLVIGGCVKVNLDQLQRGGLYSRGCVVNNIDGKFIGFNNYLGSNVWYQRGVVLHS